MSKPLHPLLQNVIVIGARVGAKTLAGAAASFLKEVTVGAREVEKHAVRAQKKIKEKLVEISPDDDDEDNEDEED